MEEYLEQWQNEDDENTIDMISGQWLILNNQKQLIPALKQFNPNYLQFMISVNLSSLNLAKFPFILKTFKCLQEIVLRNNQLKNIPSLFICYYFPYLKILDLQNNKLTSLEQVKELSALQNLEILNVLDNNIPKINSRIELVESLIFQQKIKYQQEFRQGQKLNKFTVFLKMGTIKTVRSDFPNALAACVKAEEWITINGYEGFKENKYIENDLTVDVYSLQNGALFTALDAGNEICIKGPGFTLHKDMRVEAPFVIVGDVQHKILQQQSVGQSTKNIMYDHMNHTDKIMGQLTNYDLVPEKVIKYGFFGPMYFCYQNAYKPDQYIGDQKLKLNTLDYIGKQTIKDFKIISDIPQQKLDLLKIDPKTMYPTEIEKTLKKFYQNENFTYINMNERNMLDYQKPFARLRVLNGEIITVNDMDKSNNYHRSKITTKQLHENAAYMHCKTKIPVGIKNNEAEDGKPFRSIAGLAGKDMREERVKITQIRPLSELIKRRQIYDRLVILSKQEKMEAMEDLKKFLIDGLLKDDTDGQKFTKLLLEYDSDKDANIDDFIAECKDMQQEYCKINEDASILLNGMHQANIATSIMTSQSTFKSNGPFLSPTRLAPEAIIDLTRTAKSKRQREDSVQQLSGSVFSQHKNMKSKMKLQLQDLSPTQKLADIIDDDLNDLSQDELNFQQLGLQNSKIEINNTLGLSTAQTNLNVSQQRDHIKEIQLSVLLSQKQEEEYLNSKLFGNKLKHSCLISAPGVNMSMNIKNDEALVTHFDKMITVEPIQIINDNIELYKSVQNMHTEFAEKSQILKQSFVPTIQTLQLGSNAITYDVLRNICPGKQFVNLDKLVTLQHSKAASLEPDFQMIMRNELQAQHQENNQLFAHISKTIDNNIRKELTQQSSMFNYEQHKQMRHSALLDAVMEGDRITGNPNAFKINSEYIGRIGFDKVNEAQEIVKSGKVPLKEPKRKRKTQSRILQHTSKEILQYVDTQIKRQDLQFEVQRAHQTQDGQDQELLMRQLLKTNNEQIEKAQKHELMKKHKENLKLIKREPALHMDKKVPPTLVLASVEQRKLDYMNTKIQKQKKQPIQTFVNETLRYAHMTDPSTAKPIKITSKTLAKRYGTDSVQPLNVETINEAAFQASQMHLDAAELIEKSSLIQKNAEREIAQLEQYQRDFMERQLMVDEIRQDPIAQLLKTDIDGDIIHDVAISANVNTTQMKNYDQNSNYIKQLSAKLDGKNVDTKSAFMNDANHVIQQSEQQMKKILNNQSYTNWQSKSLDNCIDTI